VPSALSTIHLMTHLTTHLMTHRIFHQLKKCMKFLNLASGRNRISILPLDLQKISFSKFSVSWLSLFAGFKSERALGSGASSGRYSKIRVTLVSLLLRVGRSVKLKIFCSIRIVTVVR